MLDVGMNVPYSLLHKEIKTLLRRNLKYFDHCVLRFCEHVSDSLLTI